MHVRRGGTDGTLSSYARMRRNSQNSKRRRGPIGAAAAFLKGSCATASLLAPWTPRPDLVDTTTFFERVARPLLASLLPSTTLATLDAVLPTGILLIIMTAAAVVCKKQAARGTRYLGRESSRHARAAQANTHAHNQHDPSSKQPLIQQNRYTTHTYVRTAIHMRRQHSVRLVYSSLPKEPWRRILLSRTRIAWSNTHYIFHLPWI